VATGNRWSGWIGARRTGLAVSVSDRDRTPRCAPGKTDPRFDGAARPTDVSRRVSGPVVVGGSVCAARCAASAPARNPFEL